MINASWDDDEPFEHDQASESLPDALDFARPTEQAADAEPISVTVTNPPGTVSVTVLIDGSPWQVVLTPRATDMTESQLAEEILLISRIARQNAQAGQHLLISSLIRRLGHDPVSTRGYLEHELGLPGVESALAAKARLLAARYAGEDG